MLGAVVYGHEQMQVAIKAISELAAEAGKPAWEVQAAAANPELESAIAGAVEAAITSAYAIGDKQERYADQSSEISSHCRGAGRRR